MIIFRRLMPGDYAQVYRLWLQTPGMRLNSRDDSEEGFLRYLRRNPSTCFVAERSGAIVGVILCGHDGRRGFIHHMAVSKSEQRSGIGSTLLRHALDALEQEGITKAALVAFENNAAGNAFWEKQGFTARPDLVYRNKALQDSLRIDT